jgi:hypothetical protein
MIAASEKPTMMRQRRLPPWLRKLVLAAHIIVSVGWLGIVVAMLVLSVTAAMAQDVRISEAAYALLDNVSDTLDTPPPASFSLAALLTGIVLALGTKWGLLKHYWILAKLVLTVAVILSGIFPVDQWIQQAISIAEQSAAGTVATYEVGSAPMLLIYASVTHLLMLGVATVISVYKPWGTTGQGRRDGARRRTMHSADGEARIASGIHAPGGADATEA